MPSYTAKELERESGFDRRTIAYYVQEGLLPKVGRRGPRTRYPQLFLDRLRFIRRVREAEEEGDVPPVSLGEMREVFERIPPALIARVAEGRIAVTSDLVSSPSTAFRLPERPIASAREPVAQLRSPAPRSYSRARARLDRMAASAPVDRVEQDEVPPMAEGPPVVESSPAQTPPPEELLLAESLVALDEIARRRNQHRDSAVETWSRIEISPNIALSLRGITEEEGVLVERVRRAIRRMIRQRSSRTNRPPL